MPEPPGTWISCGNKLSAPGSSYRNVAEGAWLWAQHGAGDPHPWGHTQHVNHPQPPARSKLGCWWLLSLIWAKNVWKLGAFMEPSSLCGVGVSWGWGCARGGDGGETRDIRLCAHAYVRTYVRVSSGTDSRPCFIYSAKYKTTLKMLEVI